MTFDCEAYGAEVAALLAPGGCTAAEARQRLQGADARKLFPHARAPEAALAGLYLHLGCWDEAHEAAQKVETREGSYWHGIVHRQEPDAANAAYWFGRVGEHPIFAELAKRAGAARWDPNRPGSDELRRVEWELLFDYCAGRAE